MNTRTQEKLKQCLSDFSGVNLAPSSLVQSGNMIVGKDGDIFIFWNGPDSNMHVKHLAGATVSDALADDKYIYCESDKHVYTGDPIDDFYYNLKHIYCDGRNTQVYVKDDVLIEKNTNRVLQWCSNSKMPNDQIILGNYAFTFIPVTTLVIPNNVIDIEQAAFIDAIDLVDIEFNHQSNNIPLLVDCVKLLNVKLEPGKRYIGQDSLLNGCISITDVSWINQLTINNSKNIFADCRSLTTVDISNADISTIRTRMFFNCNNLVSVKLPKNATRIETLAFDLCSKLKTIECPSVVEICHDAFQSCYALETLNISSQTPVRIDDSLFINRLQTFKIGIDPSLVDQILAKNADLARPNLLASAIVST